MRHLDGVTTEQYTWESIRLALQRLGQFNPDFLPNVVLVGGAACWYYRQALTQIADLDFPAPGFTPEEEKVWVSKDLDFVGDSNEDISRLIGRECPPMGELIQYAGATFDFVDEGLVFTRREVSATARRVELGDLLLYVADPALLYAEKQALRRVKRRRQDHLHSTALAQFIKWELCQGLKEGVGLEPKRWLNAAKTVKTANLAFFSGDSKTCRLLHQASQHLGPHARAIRHWIGHQIPVPDNA